LTNIVSHEILDGLLSIYRLLMNGLPSRSVLRKKGELCAIRRRYGAH
jgi:hypothetical protein